MRPREVDRIGQSSHSRWKSEPRYSREPPPQRGRKDVAPWRAKWRSPGETMRAPSTLQTPDDLSVALIALCYPAVDRMCGRTGGRIDPD